MENLTRHDVAAPLFGKEEERLLLVRVVVTGNEDRAANGVAKIVLLELWGRGGLIVKEITRVQSIIATKIVEVAMKLVRSGFGFHFYGTRSVATILRAIIGGQYLDLGDGVNAGINVQRGVAAVIHVIATVQLPVVVLRAPTVEAEGDVAIHADSAFILAGLIADTRHNRCKLREVASVELKLGDLFPRHRATQIGRRGFHLGDIFACYLDYFSNPAHGQLHVDADLLGHGQHDSGG